MMDPGRVPLTIHDANKGKGKSHGDILSPRRLPKPYFSSTNLVFPFTCFFVPWHLCFNFCGRWRGEGRGGNNDTQPRTHEGHRGSCLTARVLTDRYFWLALSMRAPSFLDCLCCLFPLFRTEEKEGCRKSCDTPQRACEGHRCSCQWRPGHMTHRYLQLTLTLDVVVVVVIFSVAYLVPEQR